MCTMCTRSMIQWKRATRVGAMLVNEQQSGLNTRQTAASAMTAKVATYRNILARRRGLLNIASRSPKIMAQIAEVRTSLATVSS